MKYRRMLAVYIADPCDLQHEAHNIWAAFMKGDFRCRKSYIPGREIGWDHAFDQENKIKKNVVALQAIHVIKTAEQCIS